MCDTTHPVVEKCMHEYGCALRGQYLTEDIRVQYSENLRRSVYNSIRIATMTLVISFIHHVHSTSIQERRTRTVSDDDAGRKRLQTRDLPLESSIQSDCSGLSLQRSNGQRINDATKTPPVIQAEEHWKIKRHLRKPFMRQPKGMIPPRARRQPSHASVELRFRTSLVTDVAYTPGVLSSVARRGASFLLQNSRTH